MACSSYAALELTGRLPKAEKIRRLMALPADENELRLLEVGTGSGAIAHYFSELSSPSFKVWAVDFRDQRKVKEGYRFQTYDGRHLPFDDEMFDVVISNHVIEHVGDRVQQENHVNEICRVLAPGGCFYLATPSRWQLVEPHFSLPFLGWVPRSWRDRYVRVAGRGDKYDCVLLRPVELRRLLQATGLSYGNLHIRAVRELSSLEGSRRILLRVAAALPTPMLSVLRNFSPTQVYLLRKSGSRRVNSTE